jgi:predicted TIM-barrel fold metal-dependent hydrolase
MTKPPYDLADNCNLLGYTNQVWRASRSRPELGKDNMTWGSDFPHRDGVRPDSQEYIERELGHLSAATKRKIVRNNAPKLYCFVN